MRLLELLADHETIKLETRRDDPCLHGAFIAFGNERRLIIVERTYREGMVALLDPTEEEVRIFHEGDLWTIWNSDKGRDMAVV